MSFGCRRGLAGLSFFLDGEDLTGAESKLTQAAMDRVLACHLLTRVVFHSQSDVAGLLEVRVPLCSHTLNEFNLIIQYNFIRTNTTQVVSQDGQVCVHSFLTGSNFEEKVGV